MKARLFILLAWLLAGPSFAHAAAGASIPDGGAFSSRQGVDRQTFGHYVAAKMSAAFYGSLADIYPCGDRAVYYCQGLMVTAFEDGESTYWMDPTTTRLSFTYFRKDIATKPYGDAGLVLWPQAYVDHEFPQGDPSHPFDPAYRCAYPLDGDTDQRGDAGCGRLLTTPSHPVNTNPDTAPCASLGITTAQQWLNKYGVEDGLLFCGFTLGSFVEAKPGMDAMTQVAAVLQNHGPHVFPWNEVVLGPWPSDQAGRIPLMAFFILLKNGNMAQSGASTASGGEEPLVIAQAQQKRYYDLTKIFVPIIVISQTNSQAVFGYVDGDQVAGLPEIVTVFPQ